MSIPSNGQYKIFNAKFTNQDADLLFGLPTTTIAGYPGNSGSLNMVWNFNAQDSNSNFTGVFPGGDLVPFTLTNTASSAIGAYASVDQSTPGAALYGSSKETIWRLQSTDQSGQYQILAPRSWDSCSLTDLVWSLASGDRGAPIMLAPIDDTASDLSQVWTFQPQNARRGINDLD
ncbi:hypothetical protein OG21DRAFT_1482937 [Imleria badia]|nr:hypothetical protein OG21DRAFT_1482937 [Imleria badia]